MEFTFMKNFKNIKNKNIKNIFAISAIAVSAIFSNNFAFAANADDIEITDEFVRLNAPNAKATGAFMNIKNKTNAEIKIISAENTVSQKTELHTHMDENGVKKMRQIPEIIIPANGSVVLKPGDLHIMLIGLNQPLQENQKVDIKINFADGSTKIISPLVIKK